jgi:predicted ATPase
VTIAAEVEYASVESAERGRNGLLLERERELAAIGEALRVTAAGAGCGLLLHGPAGIGKSRLLAEARAQARSVGITALSARGGPLEGEYPFGVARQLLEPLAREAGLRIKMLEGAGATAEPVLGPEATSARAPNAMFAVIHGLFWAMANLATERPLLVCVDDLHWADEPSLRFLDFVARRLGELPVVLMAAWRPGRWRRVRRR